MKLNYGLDINDKNAFAMLPLGAVRAEKWLGNQLTMMKNGITGEMEKFPDYIDSEWLGKSGENWERGPYYLRGLIALAYALGDETLQKRAQKWIEAILDSSRQGGMFGPRTNEDWWSRMPVLMALRDYLEAKEYLGQSDDRIIPFMTEYFRYQAEHLPSRPLSSWARARGGDNMDSVYWLYNRLYDPEEPQKTQWLLDLAQLLRDQTQDWRTIMNETTVREHVVNTSQALKMPVLYWQQSKNEADRNAFERALFNMSIDHGRTDGLPNSDEAARDNRSTRGSELCSIVEGMLSTEIALRVLREGWIGDRLESLAYNALPSGYSYDYSGHVYYILQNQVMATNGYHEFDCDHGDSSAFGAPCGFDCCFSNNHMGWPKFVQSMWMAKANGGVAATAYGPCTLTYGDIVFREKTDYPFKDRISIEYDGKEKEFELSLRIPEWCDCPRVSVNGELYSAQKGSFLEIKRVWKKGDVCELCFEMKIRTSDGYNRSRAVSAGALIFSYPVKERWSLLENNSARELKVPALGKTENRNVHPDGDWNYALFESGMELAFSQEVSAHPFTPGSAPCKIKAKAVGMPQWTLDSNIAAVQPYGGARADITKAREIELVPYGCTRLKVTHFPKAEGAGNIYYPVFKSRYNGSYYEFSSVTLPKARDYALVLSGEGEAEVHINGAFFSRVSFEDGKCSLCGLSELNVRDEMAFDSRHYNNIRVYGARVHSLEILPVSEFKELVIKEISVTDSSVKVKVNADRSFCPVTLKCGKRIGEYDITVSGFKSDTAYVNCLESGESYYIELSALINGEIFSTKPMRITTLELPEEERALAKTDVIPCRALPFYNGVSIEYSKVKGAEYYEVWYTTERGKYTSAVSGFRFNPYKGSFCFEKDILSLSLERGREYHLRLKAFNGKCQIAQSRELFIKI